MAMAIAKKRQKKGGTELQMMTCRSVMQHSLRQLGGALQKLLEVRRAHDLLELGWSVLYHTMGER